MNIDNSVKDNREKEKCNKDDSNKEANSMFVWLEKKKLTEADLGLVKIVKPNSSKDVKEDVLDLGYPV